MASKKNKLFLAAAVVATVGAFAINYYNQYNDNNDIKPQTYEEEKRIIRVNKDEISAVLPKVFSQTIKKLDYLNNNDINKLINDLKNEINNDINTFLDNYLMREYKIDIKNNNYVGVAMIKFKKDIKNNDYLYIACLVKVKKYSPSDNINNIKETINNDAKKQLYLELNKQ